MQPEDNLRTVQTETPRFRLPEMPMTVKVTASIIVIVLVLAFAFIKWRQWNNKKEAEQANDIIDSKTGRYNATGVATQLYNAFKGAGTNENLAYAMAAQMAKDNISFKSVADAFYDKYKKSLESFVASDLNNKEQEYFYNLMKPETGRSYANTKATDKIYKTYGV